MKIDRAETRAFALPLVRPLATAHGRIDSREGFFIRLIDADGLRGHGEATPLASFGTEDRSTSRAALARSLAELVRSGEKSLEESLAMNSRCCQGAPCAQAAVDSALHDLAAQRAGQSLSRWLRTRAELAGDPASRVRVQAIVSGDDPSSIRASAESLRADGFDAFKLKLATSGEGADLGRDLERVAALREAVGPSGRIRLDANEAWTFAEARSALAALESFDIDFVEQPVARHELGALKDLDQHAAISVAADEALLDSGWEACLASQAASVFVVKPAALGGLESALTLARRAREQGIRVIWSSLIDGAVSRALGFALAAALGANGEVHGLGTARLLARDLVGGAGSEGSVIKLGDSVGLDWNCSRLLEERNEIWGDVEIVESAG